MTLAFYNTFVHPLRQKYDAVTIHNTSLELHFIVSSNKIEEYHPSIPLQSDLVVSKLNRPMTTSKYQSIQVIQDILR